MKYCIRYFEMKGFPKRKKEGFLILHADNQKDAIESFYKQTKGKYLLDVFRHLKGIEK